MTFLAASVPIAGVRSTKSSFIGGARVRSKALVARRATVATPKVPTETRAAMGIAEISAAKGAAAVAAASVPDFSGVAMVTAGYVITAMNFMPLGPTAAMTGQTAGQIKWGDRTFLNMMEHAPTFLPVLWTFAFFVSAAEAAKLGAIYLALRICYPIIWAVVGGAKGAPMMPHTWFLFGKGLNLFYCTFPQYGIVFYMALATLLKMCPLAFDLNSAVVIPAVAAPLGFGLFLYHFALGFFPFIQKAVSPLFKEE